MPTETVIRQEISQLFLKQKTNENANCEGEDADEDRIRKTQSKRARIPSNFPAEAIIKRKFAALKGTFKVRQVAEFI